ncbi:MAG TPA: ATP-binding protein [Tepidisphaeraceae bacterium]|jgi:predicted kinase|nr:ATP-binding protein [Tepidisphaeraceae bacterium]
MELVLFIGLQGSGKSTFFARKFADTHIRLNMDMLNTRHREQILFEACLLAKQPTVIDNTNPTVEERARYIAAAKAHRFSVVGYYFQSRLEACKQRNAVRSEDKIVPMAGILGTYNRLVQPTAAEGFDRLYDVRIEEGGEFIVEEWSSEV